MIARARLRGISAHSFRRFFETSLENPDLAINPAWIKRMMGHKLNRNERAYSHPTNEQLRECARRFMPFLRTQRVIGEERMKAMEERLETYESENEQLRAVLEMILQQQKQIKKLESHR